MKKRRTTVMIFCGNVSSEKLVVHPNDNPHSSHYIEITMEKNLPVFNVTCCCGENWEWRFWYDKTSYDVVKHLIMDCIIGCDTMQELIDTMDDVFDANCRDMIFDADEMDYDPDSIVECDGDCDNCGFCED